MTDKKIDTQVSYTCEKAGPGVSTIVLKAGNKSSFKCDTCGTTLFVDQKALTLGAHGKTDKTIGHGLRQVKQLGVSS